MHLIIFSVIILFCITGAFIIYKQEKSREVELNFHIMQAKRILNYDDFSDKRLFFIERFKTAENHLITAQANCIHKFEINSVKKIRVELDNLKKKMSIQN